jgi:hypothetical protein
LRVDRAQFQKQKFDIYYSVTDPTVEAAAGADASEFKANVSKMVCSNAGLRRAVSRHIVVTSVLSGRGGNEISRMGVSEADCPK